MNWKLGLVSKHFVTVVYHPSIKGKEGSVEDVIVIAFDTDVGQPRPQFVQAYTCVHVGGFLNKRPIQGGGAYCVTAKQVAVLPARGADNTFVKDRRVY